MLNDSVLWKGSTTNVGRRGRIEMNPVLNSIRVWAIYLIFVPGFGLMAFPEFFLDLFDLRHGGELWMARMVGLLAFILGVLDYGIAVHRLEQLAPLMSGLRYFAAVFMVGLWMTDQVGVMILLFAAADFLAATWTMVAVRNTEAATT